MGKLITWLVALIVLGAAVWFLFLRDATDKAAEKAQDPVKTVEKIQNEEEPKSVLGKAYRHSESTVKRVNDEHNQALEAVISDM